MKYQEIPDYRLEDDREEPLRVATCIRCQEPIYDGDVILDLDGDLYCEDCRESMTRTIWSEELI